MVGASFRVINLLAGSGFVHLPAFSLATRKS